MVRPSAKIRWHFCFDFFFDYFTVIQWNYKICEPKKKAVSDQHFWATQQELKEEKKINENKLFVETSAGFSSLIFEVWLQKKRDETEDIERIEVTAQTAFFSGKLLQQMDV